MPVKTKHNRADYIKPNAVRIAHKFSSAVVYIRHDPKSGRTIVLGFAAKRQKPDFHYSYADPKQTERKVSEYFKSVQITEANAKAYAERKTAERKAPVTLEIGMVLHGSWGYDQTNAELHQVVAISGHKVMLRKVATISARKDNSYNSMSDSVIPDIGNFVGPANEYRVTDGNCVKFNRWCHLRPWKGQPVYSSWYA